MAHQMKKSVKRGLNPLLPECKKTNLWWAAKYPVLTRNENASYMWGGECDTGPNAEVYVTEEVVLA